MVTAELTVQIEKFIKWEVMSSAQSEKVQSLKLINYLGTLFSGMPGLTHGTFHQINAGDKPPVSISMIEL